MSKKWVVYYYEGTVEVEHSRYRSKKAADAEAASENFLRMLNDPKSTEWDFYKVKKDV